MTLSQLHSAMMTLGFKSTSSRRHVAEYLNVTRSNAFHAHWNFVADLLLGRLDAPTPEGTGLDEERYTTIRRDVFLALHPDLLQALSMFDPLRLHAAASEAIRFNLPPKVYACLYACGDATADHIVASLVAEAADLWKARGILGWEGDSPFLVGISEEDKKRSVTELVNTLVQGSVVLLANGKVCTVEGITQRGDRSKVSFLRDDTERVYHSSGLCPAEPAFSIVSTSGSLRVGRPRTFHPNLIRGTVGVDRNA